ncbi:YkvA family protein [Brevundimonas sp.]|uniref:YkvA family protein n=1 Tax=Brevundimonas sp. TaxID=1871086 RepID=UPI001D399C83|nr:YkvA family protein [Brevundimonas sp.]MBL0948172.1 DUF1232 domain-containing protein [Brevundimonas sp.]
MVRPAKSSSSEIARGMALIPRIDKVDEVRVERRFWPRLRRNLARIPFADQLLSVYFAARDPETPTRAKGMMLAALAYFVLPADAIPDVLVGIGFTDDAAVIAAVIAILSAHIRSRHREAARLALAEMARSRD